MRLLQRDDRLRVDHGPFAVPDEVEVDGRRAGNRAAVARTCRRAGALLAACPALLLSLTQLNGMTAS